MEVDSLEEDCRIVCKADWRIKDNITICMNLLNKERFNYKQYEKYRGSKVTKNIKRVTETDVYKLIKRTAKRLKLNTLDSSILVKKNVKKYGKLEVIDYE